MKVRLLVAHGSLGSKGSIAEVTDKDGAAMIKNKIAESLDPTTGDKSANFNNKRLTKGSLQETVVIKEAATVTLPDADF